MGLFIMCMAIGIVVVQTSLILSNREPNLWVFSLLQHKTSAHEGHNSPYTKCIEDGKNNHDVCRLWYHNTQEINTIFDDATWNPHLILLVISCIHLIICFSNAKEHFLEITGQSNAAFSSRIYHFPSSLCLCILFLLCLVVGLISSNRNLSLETSKQRLTILDSPTIIVSIVLFICSMWFLKVNNDYSNNSSTVDLKHIYHNWVLIFQLQIICVPLVVLMISVMGVRFITDIITHFVLLSVSVNTLWIHNSIAQKNMNNNNIIQYDDISCDLLLSCTRVFSLGIPLFSISIAQLQWGGSNTWQQLSVFMAFFSLAPVFIFPLFSSHHTSTTNKKPWKWIQMRLGSYCTTAALGCCVINLALL